MSDEPLPLGVGVTLYGYCAGVWGHRPGDHIVIAMGPDWLVAKNLYRHTYHLAQGDELKILARHTVRESEDFDD